MKKCKICREPFEPVRAMQCVCGVACSIAMADKKKQLKQAKERTETALQDKVKREKLKSKADWAREAQTAFNLWVRLRDAGQPCISCGRHHSGQNHAGHYLSRGARPELRFEPLNVHLQCAPCNTHLSGNVVLFRLGLIEKIGLSQVEWLEGPHQLNNYTIDDLKEIKAKYTKLSKELKNRE